jgi:hypothetical protein
MFSVPDKGSRITVLAPGRTPGRLSPRLLVSALLSAVVWTATALLSSSALCGGSTASAAAVCRVDVGQGWLIGGVVVLGYLAVLSSVDLAERGREALGQRRASSLFYLTPLLAGIVLGSGAGAAVALGPDPADGVRRALDGALGTEAAAISAAVALLAAVWLLTVVARLPGALGHARKRQSTIERLRRDGHRYAGRLWLGGVRFWLHSDPELDVSVTYESPAGRREVSARMRSSPERVPKNGSQVIVLTDLAGAVHIELDPAVEPVFEPEKRYSPSE